MSGDYTEIPGSSGHDDVKSQSPAGGNTGCLASIRQSKKTAIAVLFIAFMLDLMLLTAVEPVLPFILRGFLKANDSVVALEATGTVTATSIGEHLQSEDEDFSGVSTTEVGVLNGAKPFTQIIFNPIFGFVIDSVTLVFSPCLALVGAVFLHRFGHNVPMMVGFFFALASTLGLAMLSDVYKDPEARGKAMAVGFGGLAMGLVIGFPFGSILYEFMGREMPFLVLGALILIGAIVRFCLMPVWIKPRARSELKDGGSRCCEELTVFMDGYIFVAAGAYFFLCYGIGAVMGLGPLFLVADLELDQWTIGIVFLVGAVMQCVFQYSFAACAFRIGWWLLSMVGLFLVGIGVASYTCVTTMWMVLVPQTVYAAGIGLVMGSIPGVLGYLADIRAHSRYGAVFALSDTGTNLGYFLGSTVTGVLVSRFSYFHVFAVSGALVFVYAFSCVLLRDVPHKYVDGAPSEETRKLVHA